MWVSACLCVWLFAPFVLTVVVIYCPFYFFVHAKSVKSTHWYQVNKFVSSFRRCEKKTKNILCIIWFLYNTSSILRPHPSAIPYRSRTLTLNQPPFVVYYFYFDFVFCVSRVYSHTRPPTNPSLAPPPRVRALLNIIHNISIRTYCMYERSF